MAVLTYLCAEHGTNLVGAKSSHGYLPPSVANYKSVLVVVNQEVVGCVLPLINPINK